MNARIACLLAIASFSLVGCYRPGPSIDQQNLCEVSGWQHDVMAKACKPGQKVVFLPSSFGNAQLPVIFAAVNCDHRFSIALTEGAVSCIYSPIVPSTPKADRR